VRLGENSVVRPGGQSRSAVSDFIFSSFDKFYELSFGKRPMEELYSVEADPHNTKTQAADPKYAETKRKLRERTEELLRAEGNPRMLGKRISSAPLNTLAR
jgi:hypothetical protein